MKKYLHGVYSALISGALLIGLSAFAQGGPSELVYPVTLKTSSDSFAVRFGNYDEKYSMPVLINDTV